MKIAIYYIIIFTVATAFYMTAAKAKKYGKKAVEFLCYFVIFLEILLFM
jgi:hypothetical protein